MTKNMGGLDRTLRLFIAVLIAWFYVTGRIGGTLALVLGIMAIAFLATSLIGWCPLYVPLRVSTRRSGQPSGARV